MVDIRTVRMVANLVEKDMKRVPVGTVAAVEVDAFPGEKFSGRVSRVAPVFDPATRTAEMEIEIPNGNYRLKPGMYSRVQLTVESQAQCADRFRGTRWSSSTASPACSSPSGRRRRSARPGPASAAAPAAAPATPSTRPAGADLTAKFLPVQTGIRDGEHIEITAGLQDGARVITTGAGALKDGDRIVAATPEGARPRRHAAPAPIVKGPQREGSDR